MFIRIPVLLLCLVSIHIFAADKVEIKNAPSWLYKIAPDLAKRPPSKQITGGYYYPLFDRQVNLLTQTDYTHVIRQIENENGVQNASEVSVSFSPEYQRVVFHQLTLWRQGKQVSMLQSSQIKVIQEEADADDFQYNGIKRAFVVLKDVRKGDRIEYAYSLVGFNPVFENKYADKIYFGFETPICNYFETIIAEPTRQVYISSFNNAPKPQESMVGATKVYHWSNPSMKSWETASGAPGWYDNEPYVVISEYKTWQDVIQWGVKLFKNYKYELPAGLKNKMREWKADARGDQDVFVSHAIHFVQDQVRYLGLEIGTYTHQPHTPADVYNQLYGDCKDKALLLATILQHENIPAFVALVNTSKRSKLMDVPPSTIAFDHAIVAVERSSYLFIDPTISFQRGELVNMYVPAYGYALVIRDKESTLKPVEPGFLKSTTIREKMDVSYIDTTRFTVNTVLAGGSADNFRSTVAENSMSELEDGYLKYYEKVYEGITSTDQVTMNDDSIKNEIEVNESYAIPAIQQADEKGKEKFDVFAKVMYDLLPSPGNSSKAIPLALDFPMNMNYSLELNMPDETTLSLKELHIKTVAYQFDFDPVVNGKRVLLQYTFKTFQDHLPESEIKKYKTDYKKMVSVMDIEFTDNGNSGSISSLSDGGAPGNVNWYMVIFAVVLIGVLGYGLKTINNYTIDVPYQPGTGWPIGGWLVLLGLSLVISIIFRLIKFTTEHYFNKATWDTIGESLGSLQQLAFAAELALSLTLLCGSIGLLYWFFHKRDIFPRMFLWYIGVMVGGQLLLLVLHALAANANPVYLATLGYDFGRACVYGLVWGLYVLRSERVKCTFLESA